MSKIKPNDDDAETVFEPLLDTESSLYVFLAEPAITTVTFFKDADVEKSTSWLRGRVSAICRANPWLVGRLVRNKKLHKNVLLALPKHIQDKDIDALLGPGHDSVKSLEGISTDTPYSTVCAKLSKSNAVVGPGYKLVGKDKRISKFTLAKVGNGQVALIVSMTHAVADGHTYYKILSMLMGEIEETTYTRNHNFVPLGFKAIGEADSKYLTSFSFMLCCLKVSNGQSLIREIQVGHDSTFSQQSMMFGGNVKLNAQYVDKEKIREWKEKEAGNADYISTNDILTSTFSQSVGADVLLMAINLRNRVENTYSNDAGNYSLVVVHDRQSSKRPSDIRTSLNDGPPFKRKGNSSLPGFYQTVKAQCSLITNWAFSSFNADIELPTSTEGTVSPIELHLPVYDPKSIAFPIAIIFKPKAGRLGMIYGGSPKVISQDRLAAANAPLKDQISSKMFSQV